MAKVFPLIGLLTISIFFVSFAFAENVSILQGTSVPGCETSSKCFSPYEITIKVGNEVTWSNDDSAAHTVTAGSAANGPSGLFDSSLFMSGTTFTYKFNESGTFPYFCMVHPWMKGIVTVQAEGSSGLIMPGIGEPPLKQIQKGVEPKEVVCKEDLQLIFKHNGNPACVKNSSVEKLIQRGWTR